MSTWQRLGRRLGRQLLRTAIDTGSRHVRRRLNTRGSFAPAPTTSSGYPGDYRGTVDPLFSPSDNTIGDPGEIVWAWVPYEEDHSQGKDRPVLLIGRNGPWVLGLQLTSKDHDRDATQEARAGRFWMDIGSGDWDRQRRPSEVRVNRVLQLDPTAIRREGAVLDRDLFDAVVAEVNTYA